MSVQEYRRFSLSVVDSITGSDSPLAPCVTNTLIFFKSRSRTINIRVPSELARAYYILVFWAAMLIPQPIMAWQLCVPESE
jgi:hypothetical protein